MTRYAWLCAVVLLAAGCLTRGEVQTTTRYTLDPAPRVDRAAGTLSKTLGIRDVQAARHIDKRMVYRDADLKLGYREYDEWADQPDYVVTQAVTKALVATHRFSDVGDAIDMARPDLILTGQLRKFQENRTQTPWAAEIELRLELRDSRDARLVWAETLTASVPMEGETAADFAAAMNTALTDVAGQAANAMSKAAQ